MANTEEPESPSILQITLLIVVLVIALPAVLTLSFLGLEFIDHVSDGWERERIQQTERAHTEEMRERFDFITKNPIR